MIICLCACSVKAACTYDAQKNAISVVDYPESVPCTLNGLLTADKMNGWGKLSYDQAADTYTVACDLIVGANNGTHTYLQVGSKEHPNEVLVLRGSLVIPPYWVKDVNTQPQHMAPKCVNRVTLGLASDPSIKASLKFDCRKSGEFGLSVGKDLCLGGQLHVFNSTITSTAQKPGLGWAGPPPLPHPFMGGESFVFDHATIAWCEGAFGYHMNARAAQVKDTTFEYGESANYGGNHLWRGCTFRHMKEAIFDSGGLDMTLINGVFEDNVRNWALPYTDKGLTLIDCTIKPPTAGNRMACWKNEGKTRYPNVWIKHHVVVEAADAAGKPVPGAQVEVACEQKAENTVGNAKAPTGADGKTPGKEDEAKAILLTESQEKATDVENKTAVTEYTYEIKASAPEVGTVSVKGFKPTENWQTVKVVLAKQ